MLLLSIDGMHEVDLANFIAKNPASALASLAKTGVQYSKAYVNNLDGTAQNPSDSFPGLLALTTGASSPTHGGWYDVSYARDLYTDSTCTVRGTAATYDESIEIDNTGLWGNAKVAGPTHDIVAARKNINTAAIPWQKTQAGCTPVYAHNFIRVNTVFEVVHNAGMRTAWSDKHLTYEMVSGPSGAGVDDFFAPEINSLATNLPMPTGVTPGASDDFTTNYKYTKVYDDYKVQAILNQIDGNWSDTGLAGATDTANPPGVTPAVFGMNFQAVSVAQKDSRAADAGGYSDALGTPNADLADALAHTDASIGKMVAELKAKGELASTLIIVTAKHGQSPIDHTLFKKQPAAIDAVINTSAPVAGHIEDDVGLYWLRDSSTAPAAVTALTAAAGTTNDPYASTIYTTAMTGFIPMFGDPTLDPRTPDVIIKVQPGVIYTGSSSKWAEHGGFAEDDAHVALLVSNPAIAAATDATPVRTKQVAPTILAALCLDPTALEGVQKEGTAVLPTVTFPKCTPPASPMEWTASAPPAIATISGGPWTVKQLQAGLAADGETYTFGTKLKHLNAGYCTTWGNPAAVPPVLGVMATNSGVAPMSPYYWPMVIGSGKNLQGFFDWRDKDTNEAIVAASSNDGGKTWVWQQTAMFLNQQCPADDTKVNTALSSDGVTPVVDDGYGHSYVFDVGGVSRIYTLDRSFANIDNAGLVVYNLTAATATLQTGASTSPLTPLPAQGPIEGAGLKRTSGLVNPDGIFAVVPGSSNPTLVLYVEKQVGAALSLPAAQQCPTQPYAPVGATAPKAANTDIVMPRLASTYDGVNFDDMGPVKGLHDPTTTSYLGTRYVAGGGTMLKVDATHYGLFFSGGNCMDADSDSFHYVGYAESTDLVNWTVINGINNPIASIGTEVLTINGVQTQIPAQMPVVGPAQHWFMGRVYSPSINKLDATHVSMSFAGYGVQTPNNGLEDYRQVGNVVLTSSRPLP